MVDLTHQKCVPCEGGIPPLSKEEIDEFKSDVPEWQVCAVEETPHLKRTFKFNDFKEALAFTNKIGKLAEDEGHHPMIILEWGQVRVEWWTHAIEGLHKNDFIMAAKTTQAYEG